MSRKGLFKEYDSCVLEFIDSDHGGDAWENSRGDRWDAWMGDRVARNDLVYEKDFFLVLPLEYLK